jgi:hypothetical protein
VVVCAGCAFVEVDEEDVEGRAADRGAGDEVSELGVEVAGAAVVLGFWKSLRMSTLLSLGVGVGERAGAAAAAAAAAGAVAEEMEGEGEAELDFAMRGTGALVATGEDADGLDCFDEDASVDANDGGLPFTGELAAGTDPNDLTTFSDLIGGAVAGDEDIGAATSSIEPKVTAEPCFAAPTLLRGMLTPSFMDTPLRALGRLEWVCVVGD